AVILFGAVRGGLLAVAHEISAPVGVAGGGAHGTHAADRDLIDAEGSGEGSLAAPLASRHPFLREEVEHAIQDRLSVSQHLQRSPPAEGCSSSCSGKHQQQQESLHAEGPHRPTHSPLIPPAPPVERVA
ncbi:unnamed protein product, partial [Ectocarpus sp. 12 AP-2014]